MKKFLKKKLNNEKGLTLIELLAVIVILAIIAAIAIPAIGNIIENSRYSAVKADATNVLSSANIYFTENPNATGGNVTLKTLVDEDYMQAVGIFEKVDDKETVVITKANPNTLTAPEVIYSGSKTVKFTNASIDGINKDDQKGSDDDDREISN